MLSDDESHIFLELTVLTFVISRKCLASPFYILLHRFALTFHLMVLVRATSCHHDANILRQRKMLSHSMIEGGVTLMLLFWQMTLNLQLNTPNLASSLRLGFCPLLYRNYFCFIIYDWCFEPVALSYLLRPD